MKILSLGMGSTSQSILMDRERNINNALLFLNKNPFIFQGSAHIIQ